MRRRQNGAHDGRGRELGETAGAGSRSKVQNQVQDPLQEDDLEQVDLQPHGAQQEVRHEKLVQVDEDGHASAT